jgi:hypothetical protein
MALVLRNFKKFMKNKYYKKGGGDKTKPSERRCYECKEVGHYIADCSQLKNKEKGGEEVQGEEQGLQEEILRSSSCWSRVGV